jgi:hypothetical protein
MIPPQELSYRYDLLLLVRGARRNEENKGGGAAREKGSTSILIEDMDDYVGTPMFMERH